MGEDEPLEKIVRWCYNYNVKSFQKRMRTFLKKKIPQKKHEDLLDDVVGELIPNAYLHGNLELLGIYDVPEEERLTYTVARETYGPDHELNQRKIYLILSTYKDRFEISVRDEGKGFSKEKFDGILEESYPRKGPTSGWGLLFAKVGADEIRHELGGRQITVVKYLHKN